MSPQVKTFQVLTLARMYLGRNEEFAKKHTHDWLLWEPGEWNPIAPGGTLVVTTTVPNNHALTGGLAIALEPNAQGSVSIGRELPCEVVIHDGTLSKRHLQLSHVAGAWLALDVAGKQSAWCNGKLLEPKKPVRLEPGARLQAGKVLLTFYDSAGLFERLKG